MKTLIIAEIGSNHDGSIGNAGCMIDASAVCGAGAVKFQTHIAEAETLPDAPMPPYFRDESRYEYFNRTGFTKDQWIKLKAHAEERGLIFLSSPFSIEAVELLEDIGITQYKVPSGEVTNLPMLEKIAKTEKPVILSSGMSTWAELDEAVETILKYHNKITLLQCTSEYPCPYERVGLNIMSQMRERYRLPVGLSDHTLSNYAAFAAVTLGATVIEKHFTLSRMMYGSDAKNSLEPAEFKELVQGIQAINTMMKSDVDKDAIERFAEMKATFEKSIVSSKDIPAGTEITKDMVCIKKPGTGMPTKMLSKVIGSYARRDIPRNHILQEEDIIQAADNIS